MSQDKKFETHLTNYIRKDNPDLIKNINFITGANQTQKLSVVPGTGDSKVGNSVLFKSNLSSTSTK